jgi:hypothetical protein
MAFWEFLASVVGTVVGTIVGGVMRLFGGQNRRRSAPSTPTQQVIAIAPATLIQWQVPLTEEVREILEISRNQAPSMRAPKLYIPGEGVVTADRFIGHTIDTMLIDIAESTVCCTCGRKKNRGAFFNNCWFCTICFYEHVKGLANGEQSLFAGQIAPHASTWDEMREMLTGSRGVAMLTQDAALRKLASAGLLR